MYSLQNTGESLEDYAEEEHLSLFVTGNDRPLNWHTLAREVDFLVKIICGMAGWQFWGRFDEVAFHRSPGRYF